MGTREEFLKIKRALVESLSSQIFPQPFLAANSIAI